VTSLSAAGQESQSSHSFQPAESKAKPLAWFAAGRWFYGTSLATARVL